MQDITNEWLVALLAFGLTQGADVITTIRFMRRGGREMNPLLRRAMTRLGRYGWILVKAGGAGLAVAVIPAYGAIWMLWVLTGLTALIAWRNTRIGRR